MDNVRSRLALFDGAVTLAGTLLAGYVLYGYLSAAMSVEYFSLTAAEAHAHFEKQQVAVPANFNLSFQKARYFTEQEKVNEGKGRVLIGRETDPPIVRPFRGTPTVIFDFSEDSFVLNMRLEAPVASTTLQLYCRLPRGGPIVLLEVCNTWRDCVLGGGGDPCHMAISLAALRWKEAAAQQ
jgi:hypothetical protein